MSILPHYVYTLAYPESMGARVFYVGKGQGYRINAHESEVKCGFSHNPYKANVIKKIWNAQEQVEKEILARFATEQEAFLYEIALIFFMNGLTNLTEGGEGSNGRVVTEEERKLTSQLHKGKVAPSKGEGVGRKISESLRKRALEQNLALKNERSTLPIDEAAKLLKVSKDTIRRMIKRGELEAVRVGGQIRIKAASLQKYL